MGRSIRSRDLAPVYRQFESGSLQFDDLAFTLSPLFPVASDARFALELGGRRFLLENATRQLNFYEWSNHGLNWADNDMVAVKLIELGAPAAPTNLTAQSMGSTQIKLSWTPPSKTGGSDITGYKIEVSTDGGMNYTVLVADTESTDTSYVHRGLSSGDTRHYQVSAINDIGTSSASNAASGTTMSPASDITTPTTNADGSTTVWSTTMTVGVFSSPPGLISVDSTGFADSHGSIGSNQFTWDGTQYSITRLRLYRQFESGSLQFDDLAFTLSPLFPVASDARFALELGGRRFLLENATRQLNFYEWSNHGLNWADNDMVAVKLIELGAPAAPTNLTAQSMGSTQIKLSWTPPSKTGGSDITGYKIEVSTDGGMNYTVLVADTESTDTSYVHRGLSSGDTRHYQVSAINDIGTSSASNAASGTTMSPASDITTPTTNADGSTTVWSTTMTVGVFSSPPGLISVDSTGFADSHGSIGSNQFTWDGTQYSITRLRLYRQFESGSLQFDDLAFTLSTLFPSLPMQGLRWNWVEGDSFSEMQHDSLTSTSGATTA